MGHALIAGQTESGKTRLAHHIEDGFLANGYPVLIYDPIGDPQWLPEDLEDRRMVRVFRDPDQLADAARRSRVCGIFIDEAHEVLGQHDRHRHWIVTRGRHKGHVVHLISQRVQGIGKTPRDQCTRLFLFNSSLSDSKLLADEWNCEALRGTHKLEQAQFFQVDRFGQVKLCRIDVATLEVKRQKVLDRTNREAV